MLNLKRMSINNDNVLENDRNANGNYIIFIIC